MSIIPKCSFRIIGLSEDELSGLIEKHLSDVEYHQGKNHKEKDKKVLRIDIDTNIDAGLLSNLIDDVPDLYYDFVVSVSSEQESAMVDIPELVLELYKKVGGKICFSYTCI